MQNTKQSTAVPVINAENFTECQGQFRHEKVPAEYEEAARAELRKGMVRRADVTLDGDPTRWMIWEDGDEIHWGLWDKYPCSIEWCETGHDPNEADTWDDLTHQSEDYQVEGIGGVAIIQHGDGPHALNIYTDLEGDVELDDTASLYVRLTAFRDVIQIAALKAQHLTAGGAL